MTDNNGDVNELAFVHLNDDVIVPVGMLRVPEKNRTPLILSGVFGIFGVIWFILFVKVGFSLENFLITFPCIMIFPVVISFAIRGEKIWYEIDRKSGEISVWSDKKKKKKLYTILKDNISIVVVETGTGGARGGLQWVLRAQGTDREGKELFVRLFILPEKTPKEGAEALAKVIEEFLIKFLSGKTDTADREKYRFSLAKQ